MEPSNHPRRILLAVTGLSPQVVTETLYALTVRRQPPFLPTEIHLVTTSEGAERARLMLLDPDDGRYFQFCSEYAIAADRIAFDESHIHVVRDTADRPLADITSERDNTTAADFITKRVKELTSDPVSALHASIAGGRKTMGFYLGYALSLYGREQDRLSHVLVSPPFESDHQFYYPPARSRRLIIKERPVHTSEAQVMLADIPFVRLRHGLPDSLLEGQASFSATVEAAQLTLGPPRLVIDLEARRIACGGIHVELPPADLAFLLWFARRARQERPGVCRSDIGAKDTAEYLSAYRALHDELSGDVDRIERALRHGMDPGYFDSRLSNLNKRLRRALGKAGAGLYRIASDRRRPWGRYSLPLAPDQIRFEALPGATSLRTVRKPQQSDHNDPE